MTENNFEYNLGGNLVRKYYPWLVPALSILIIFQSIVLIINSTQTMVNDRMEVARMKAEPFVPVPPDEVSQGATVKLAFVPSGVSIKKGQSTTVDLFLTPKKNLQLDGADIVLNFDPKILEITQVTTPKLFSFVSQKKEKESEGKIYVTFLEEGKNGLYLNKESKLMTLTLKGKTSGVSNLSIATANEGATTVITETGTSKKISFDKGSIQVVVY